MEIDAEVQIAEELRRRGVEAHENASVSTIQVSLFDYSVENHFEAVDTISKLTGVPKIEDTDQAEIKRLASSITFLTEWKYLNYKRREVKFACEDEISKGIDVIGEISLPQFSSSEVPKKQLVNEQQLVSKELSKDFVMYVGGLVWGLDWCPQACENRDTPIRSEFVAVAAHPPDSSYNKIGAPVTGKGVIQIWCLLDLFQKDDLLTQVNKKTTRNTKNNIVVKGETPGPQKPRGRPRKNPVETVKGEMSGTLKPRGRPRKHPVEEPLTDADCDVNNLQPLAIEYLQQSTEVSVDLSCESTNKAQEDFVRRNHERSIDVASVDAQLAPSKKRGLKTGLVSAGFDESAASTKRRKKEKERNENLTRDSTKALPMQGVDTGSPDIPKEKEKERTENQTHDSTLALLTQDVDNKSADIPKDVCLPRMVLSLAHNGKIARDVKWRPLKNRDVSRHRMGYLAVVLGNGTLEVWEVPFPHIIKAIYPSVRKKGTDPRFLKLQPVFRSSMPNCCNRQSIPLTVEWSTSPPYDVILAGFHDGVVALWKFSTSNSSKVHLSDTRPLLCFSADTIPIRALSWAPFESSSGNANIIITAGDRGLKFWDLRDPFHHLREYNPGQGVYICSVDWLAEPRCVVIACNDGTLKILSLPKVAYDVPVTGNPLVRSKLQGFHSFTRSFNTLWSVHASRVTGMVTYCGADGTAVQFQMTSRMENDAVRNRTPHFLCGSFSEDESGIISVITPVRNSPFRMFYSRKQWRDSMSRPPHSVPNQEKQIIEQSDERPLALCYGDDTNIEGSDEELAAQKNKQKSKTRTKTTSNKPVASECALVNSNEDPDKFEKLPPKIVSINRVRWNMNKGCERWLCYGGAAGLVRCQKIFTE